MSMLDRIRDGFKYLDKNGLKHLIDLIKNHDVHWTGTHAEYEAQKDSIPAYAILHFTDDYDEGTGVHPDWAHAISLTATQLTAGYTAPSDGMFVGRWVNSSSAGAEMTINNVAVGVASNNTSGMIQCPVSSGDVIKNNGTTGTSGISFVPWKI